MTEALTDKPHEIARKFADLMGKRRGVKRLWLGKSGSYPVELYLMTGKIGLKAEKRLNLKSAKIHELYPPPTKDPSAKNPFIRVWLLNPKHYEPHFKVENLVPHTFEEIPLGS